MAGQHMYPGKRNPLSIIKGKKPEKPPPIDGLPRSGKQKENAFAVCRAARYPFLRVYFCFCQKNPLCRFTVTISQLNSFLREDKK